MSFDEYVFHKIWKLKGRFRNPSWAEAAHFEDLKLSLESFAGCLFKGSVGLGEAETFGSTGSSLILLPRRVSFFSTKEMNERFYFFRLLLSYGYTVIQKKVSMPAKAWQQQVLGALLMSRVREFLSSEFPNFSRIESNFYSHYLMQRPKISRIRTYEDLYGAWEFVLLGGNCEDLRFASLFSLSGHQTLQVAEDMICAFKLKGKFQKVPEFTLWGRFFYNQEKCLSEEEVLEGSQSDSNSTATEKEKAIRENIRVVDVEERKEEQELPVFQILENTQTAEDFLGGQKNVDASDELMEHAEALDDLEMRSVTRSSKKAQSIFRSNLLLDVEFEESDPFAKSEARAFLYDEWDFRRSVYKKSWCRVVEQVMEGPSEVDHSSIEAVLKSHRKEITELKGRLKFWLNDKRWRSRQSEGPEIDLNAVIDYVSDPGADSFRLFQSRKKSINDVAVLLLMDTSLSTDAWVGDKRVIDISKDAVVSLLDIFEALNVPLEVVGFNSRTRRDCRYLKLKSFRAKQKDGQRTVLAVQPEGYTRIGPAIRHGVSCLGRRHAKKKIILLLTDGKPSDYDAYEGRYGIEDVRQSLREATQHNIQTYGFAIDRAAKTYFPKMFGPQNYYIVPQSGLFLRGLVKCFTRQL